METKQQMEKGTGLRLNDGKLRYDLLEPYAIQELVKVFTLGAKKYEPNNWLRGMKWSVMLASLKRHLAAFEQGEDFDKESGLHHIAHTAWNALGLVSYYKHYPMGDDRLHHVVSPFRIGLDVDEVICDWVTSWCERFNLPIPTDWNFQWNIQEYFRVMKEEGSLSKFYLDLKPKEDPKLWKFDPIVYISHRPVDEAITRLWLRDNGFPLKDVVHVKNREDKIKVAKEYKLDIFVDDNYSTYLDMNRAGICCYLKDAKHNEKFEVGYRRIKKLNDLPV